MEATAFLLLFDYVLPKRIWAEKICVTSESYLFRFPFFPSFGSMRMGIEFEGNASSNLVFWPAASALPGSFLEIQVLCPHPRHTESETLVLEFSTPCLEKKKKNQVGLMQGNICQLLPTGNAKHQVGPDWLISSLSELPTLPGPPAYLHPLMWRRNKLLLLETSVIFCLLFVFLKYLFIGVSLM